MIKYDDDRIVVIGKPRQDIIYPAFNKKGYCFIENIHKDKIEKYKCQFKDKMYYKYMLITDNTVDIYGNIQNDYVGIYIKNGSHEDGLYNFILFFCF